MQFPTTGTGSLLDEGEAAVLLQRARDRQDEPSALLTIGLQLLAGGCAGQALEVFSLGRSASPTRIEFDLGIGASHLQRDEYELARLHTEAHLERFPNSALGYFHLAMSLAALDRADEMYEALLKSISLDPSNQQVLGYFYALHERNDEVPVATACLERFADDMRAAGPRLFLARVASDAGIREAACAYLTSAMDDIDPGDASSLKVASELMLDLDRPDDCIGLLEDLEVEMSFEPLFQLARAYRCTGEVQLARTMLPRLQDLATSLPQRERIRALEAQLAS